MVDDRPADSTTFSTDPIPGGLTTESTVLIASAGDPSQYAVALRLLCEHVDADDAALLVTTTESVDRTIETYDRLCSDPDRPSFGFVDTVSERQSVTALYEETPVVFTPSPADLERLVVALSDLSADTPPSEGSRHLVVRSLTPLLESEPTAHVGTVLDRIAGLRSETGLCLLGIDYTAHDEETMAAMTARVDGVLWVTHTSSKHLEFEYRPTPGRHARSVTGGDIGD